LIALAAAFVLALPAAQLPQLPQIAPLPAIRREPQITYVDRNGVLIGVRGGRHAPPVDIAKLPAYVPAAFVAIEDRRFYEHNGIDARGIGRAIVNNISEGRMGEGASTITQQLARNLFLTNERTAERKAREAVIALQIEQKYTKRQILGLYLSRVYFGGGAYGLEAASQRFFNKPAKRLTLKEAAMLAAVLKSPTAYNPAEQPQASRERAALVLAAMVETGAITGAQQSAALREAPRVWARAPNASAQYFVDWVDGQTRRLVGQPKQDMTVETTLDLPTEAAADEAARATIAALKGQPSAQAAIVALDGTGRVRAMLGGVDYTRAPYNRAVDARRQAGSAWKPFVYLTALEAGRTPDTLVVDEPITIGGWSPANYSQTYLGEITLERALAQSVNTVAVRLADEVGREAVAQTARRVGITSVVNTEPAMALGTTLVSPLEMAQAYAAFGNGGFRVQAYGVERILGANGAVLYQPRQPAPAAAIGNPALGELNRMLRAVVASGTGTRAAISGYDIAGKTGTTSDYKDAWFSGYTGGLTTVVWMGRDDNAPLAATTGGGAPAELWRKVMTAAVKRLPVQPIPYGTQPPPAPPPPPADAIDAILTTLP